MNCPNTVPVSSPLERLLGSLEALLEPPGVLLGTSWAILRHSGGLPGASWAPFGPSWAVLEATQNKTKMKSIFEPQTRAQKAPTIIKFWAPFWAPKSTKMAPKPRQNLRRCSRAKKLPFKTLLEPSWADLEAFWRPSWGLRNRCGIGRCSVW